MPIPALEKAYIAELGTGGQEVKGSRFPVQFNPTTLKLQISASAAKGTPSGSQVRQFTGPPTSTLTLDLAFDTADEGDSQNPRSVREKTARVERFVFPKDQSEKGQKPPKIRFHWGSFKIDGVVASVNLDLDHFAANGTPLRAKVSLTIEEQKSELIFRPDENQKLTAPKPGQPTAGAPGSHGGPVDRVTAALGGESLPELAARVGLDPGAWRGLSTGISGGLSGNLSLEAGVEVGFSAELSVNAGLGVTLGVEAGVSATLEASFGLEASVGINAVAGVGVGGDLASGISLSAGGGLSAALETVQIVKSQAATQQARQAFEAPTSKGLPSIGTTVAPPSLTPKPAPPEQPRAPLTSTGIPSPAQQLAAPAAPALPRADPRSTSFGFGVPLRSTVGAAAGLRAASLQGQVALRAQTGDGFPPSTEDPTVPPWVALPARDAFRADASNVQQKRRPLRPCGCSDGHRR